MQIPNNPALEALDRGSALSERDKAEIYAALYGLNSGIHQVLNSINFLDREDLGLPFLNGYRILADEIRSGINFTAAEALSILELRGYREQEGKMQQNAVLNCDSAKTE